MEGTLQQAGVDQTLPGRGDCALGRAGIPARYRPGHSTADIADHFQIAARLLVCCDAGGSKAGRTGPGRPGSPRSLWAGDLIINTISAVTTRTGLTVTAVLDHSPCPTGTRVSNEQMTDLEPGCGGVGFLGGGAAWAARTSAWAASRAWVPASASAARAWAVTAAASARRRAASASAT